MPDILFKDEIGNTLVYTSQAENEDNGRVFRAHSLDIVRDGKENIGVLFKENEIYGCVLGVMHKLEKREAVDLEMFALFLVLIRNHGEYSLRIVDQMKAAVLMVNKEMAQKALSVAQEVRAESFSVVGEGNGDSLACGLLRSIITALEQYLSPPSASDSKLVAVAPELKKGQIEEEAGRGWSVPAAMSNTSVVWEGQNLMFKRKRTQLLDLLSSGKWSHSDPEALIQQVGV